MPALAAILRVAIVMGICSCSVREHFEGQPVPRSIETPPLGLSVAVLSDRSISFEYPPVYSLSAFEEVMNPGLAETLRNGLDPAFDRVSIVENERAAAEMDLLAMPAIEVSDSLTLTVTFRESCSGRDITRLFSSRSLDGHAFGMYSHLGTDLMLFATAVIVPPLDPLLAHTIRKHSAERFDAMLTPAIVQMAGDIAQQAVRDRSLRSFLQIRNRRLMSPRPPIDSSLTCQWR